MAVPLEEKMREEWNQRARTDAYYYVATARQQQDKAEFLSTAGPVLALLRPNFERIRTAGPAEERRALEIGCGPGRLMVQVREFFTEVHGIDVSDEMIALARQHLAAVPGAFAHHGSGSDLAGFPSAHFDFVYSYAVFQHIPSAAIVTRYLEESARVLKPGGVLCFQVRGAATTDWNFGGPPDTWGGCVYPPEEVLALCRRCGLHLLQITGGDSQNTCVAARKPLDPAPPAFDFDRAILNAITPTSNPYGIISTRGAGAAFHCWLVGFPEFTSLEQLEVTVGGISALPCYIGDHLGGGGFQLNVLVPPSVPLGEALVQLAWNGRRVRGEQNIRICEYPRPVPSVVSVRDGVDLAVESSSTTGSLKLLLHGVADPQEIAFTIESRPIQPMSAELYDSYVFAYEFTLTLPPDLPSGVNRIHVSAPGWSETVEFQNLVDPR